MAGRRNREPIGKLDRKALKRAWRIFTYMAPYKWMYIIGLFFLMVTSLVFLAFSQLMQYLVDSARIGEQVSAKVPFDISMKEVGIALVALLVMQSVFSYFRVYLFATVTENALADLRNAVYRNLIRLPMRYFSSIKSGEINSRMASDISQIQEILTTTLAEFIRQIVIIVGGILLLVFTSFKLTAAMLSVVPVLAFAAVFFGRFIRKLSRKVQDEIATSTGIVEEAVTGIATVKAFTNELFEIARFSGSVRRIRKAAIRGASWRGAFASFIILCIFGAIVGVIWYAIYLVDVGELSYGKMFKFILLSLTIGFSFGGITELYAAIQKGIGATERVFELIDQEPEEIDLDSPGMPDISLKSNVRFENLSFAYPNRPETTVIDQLSFEAPQGAHIAIVGPSGAGKSTLLALIMRYYAPTMGAIYMGNKKVCDYDLRAYRSRIAVVPQDILLFSGTIKNNISYGKTDAGEAAILRAARQANAAAFIEAMPQGYNTQVGDRGTQVSGGQRQRIAIARAMLKNPDILILDEATSSLDSDSEQQVQQALEVLMEGRTTFVIAHRLSTIRKADVILVLDKGRLVEQGNHEALVNKEGGLYKHLSQLQFQE